MAQASRDENRIPTLLGVSSADGTTPVTLFADPTTHRLYVDLAAGGTTTVDAGTTTTLAPGASATVVNSGTTSDAVFDFGIPAGEKGDPGDPGPTGPVGMVWKDAYVGATAYVVNDAVSYNGSSYICILNSTGNLPTDTTYWSLVAQKGSDGLGAGDMLASVYDPTNVAGDAFDMDNMEQGTTNKFLSSAELTVVQNTSGTNTGDQEANDFDIKDLTDSTNLRTTWNAKVDKSLFDANTILYATTDDTPVALTIPEQTIVGRKTGGNIEALAIDNDLSSVSANDDTVPSAKATKAMGDLKLAIASKATQAEVATGTDDTKYVTSLAVQPYSNNSLYRQAIINGNFDVWQRGTSFSSPSNGTYLADRWANNDQSNSTISRQTSGVPEGSQYYIRITQTNNGYGNIEQALESSTVDKLKGKTVTLSVKIRRNDTLTTDILLRIEKNATADTLTGGIWTTLQSSIVLNANIPTGTTSADWYTASVTTTIPTDGTANGIRFRLDYSSVSPIGGYVEYAQVQLNAGSVALPFQPKSFAEELRDCQRYFQTRVVRTINGIMNYGLPEDLRTTPSIATASAGTIANATATGYQITHNANANSTVVLSAEL